MNTDVAVTGSDSYCWHKVPLPNSLSIKMPAYGPVTSLTLSYESAEMPRDTDMLCPHEKVCHLGLEQCLLYNSVHKEEMQRCVLTGFKIFNFFCILNNEIKIDPAFWRLVLVFHFFDRFNVDSSNLKSFTMSKVNRI